jgi:hypothetical protein
MALKIENEFFYQNQDGVFSATDYAALWGSTVGNGPLFYNVADNLDVYGPREWQRFALACGELIREMDYRIPANAEDIYWLSRLQTWAIRNATLSHRMAMA